ncbi:MAG: SIMPL domain-containing protein [Candidatus Paceibacterota bacterium]
MMHSKIKNVLGLAGIIALLAVAIAVMSYVKLYEKTTYPPSFSSTGEGTVVAVPDVAKFSFGVTSQGGTDVAALQADNTAKMNAVMAFLAEEGIKSEDIKTSQYTITPRRDFNRPTINSRLPGEIVGYTVLQRAEVTIRDFGLIGPVLSGVVTAGANNVSDFRFTFDDPLALTNEARSLAIAEAKRQAAMTAESAGFKIGRLMSVHENNFSDMYRMGLGGDGMVMESAAFAPPVIEPGSEEIKVNITLTYEIKN